METETKTDKAYRELTASECKIAIAQIEDRLKRIAKAQKEFIKTFYPRLAEYSEDEHDQVMDEVQKMKMTLREKYNIPNGVHIFDDTNEEALREHNLQAYGPYIKAFVKGQLTEFQYHMMVFHFEEAYEFDYGWVLIERPLCYYDAPNEENVDIDEIHKEMFEIGTRSKIKNTKLEGLWPYCGLPTN